eukprot:154057_1
MRCRSRSHRIISAQRITSARLFHALTQMGVPPWLMRPKEKLFDIFQVNSDAVWISFPDFLDSAIPAFFLQDISISRSEIYSELIHGCKQIDKVFSSIDTDGSLEITFEEMRKSLFFEHLTDSELQTVFDNMDKSNDGNVDHKEFIWGFAEICGFISKS